MTCMDQTHPATRRPIFELSSRLADRLRQIRSRRRLKRLIDMDDQTLDDIGVTRGEVQIATGLPLSIDAATELRRMSLERRRNRM